MTPNTQNPLGREDEHEGRERPAGLTDEHLAYLDGVRESGVTNMYGAAPWLARAFDLDRKTASAYLIYWMQTFSTRHPKENR